jgi:hypothetical protein
MIELIIAVLIVVTIKHFFKHQQSKSFNQNELIELIESRQQYRAKARKCL